MQEKKEILEREKHEGYGLEGVSANKSFYNRSVLWSPSTGQDRRSTRRVPLLEFGNSCSASTVYDWEERRYIYWDCMANRRFGFGWRFKMKQ